VVLSIVMTVYVCLSVSVCPCVCLTVCLSVSVCPSVRVSQGPYFLTSLNLLHMLPVAQSFHGRVKLRYVLPVLRTTSRFPTGPMATQCYQSSLTAISCTSQHPWLCPVQDNNRLQGLTSPSTKGARGGVCSFISGTIFPTTISRRVLRIVDFPNVLHILWITVGIFGIMHRSRCQEYLISLTGVWIEIVEKDCRACGLNT